MNNTDLVKYNTAWLLGCQGFDWPTEHYLEYAYEDNWKLMHSDTPQDFNRFFTVCSVPTINDALKWLKEAKDCEIVVSGCGQSDLTTLDITINGVPHRYQYITEFNDLSEALDKVIYRVLILLSDLEYGTDELD